MVAVRVEGTLSFATPKKLEEALRAFDALRYTEFAAVEDFTREKASLTIASDKDVEADCVNGFADAYVALAKGAAYGFIDVREEMQSVRAYAGGQRIVLAPGKAGFVLGAQLAWRGLGAGHIPTAIQTWTVAADGDTVAVSGGPEGAVRMAGISKFHRSVLKGSDARDWAIVLFKLSTGREIMRCSGPKWLSAGVALDPEGKRVAAACADDLVYVWDIATGKQLAKTKAHKGGALIVAWSSDGARLFSGGADQTLAIWDAATLAESSREKLAAPVKYGDLVSRGAVAPGGGGLTLKNSRTELGPRAEAT